MLLIGGLAVTTVAAQLSDYEISNAVDDALIDDSATPAWNIDVATDQGIVTLSGTVNNILAEDRAEKIASTVKGVKGIINRLTVSAPFRADTEIEEDVRDALLWDPVTESWELSASVDNGMVTLNGVVDSWQEKQLASKVAKGVSGVKGIINQVSVDYKTERSDAEMEEEIQQALRWDAYVDDALITVNVDNGQVTLTGTVGSLAEKREAWTEAWVAGVSQVDNNLDVESWARDERFRVDKYVDMSDQEIENAVNDAFLYDPRVNMFDLDVEAVNGQVTLRGTVDNLSARRAAAQDARSVVGVWGVENRVKVRPGTPSDDTIEDNVEDALVWDPYVDRYEIDVAVTDGEVYLYGDVDSTFEKAQADDVASRQVGVRDVNNFLTVNVPGPAIYSPYVGEWYLYDYDWYATANLTATESDWEIENDIEGELFWSPFVDSDEVNVEVEDGIAMLTGTVDTWGEYQSATENAFEGGAVGVDNNLTVHYGPDYYNP
jgi:osmotically-inducible protein OsmY